MENGKWKTENGAHESNRESFPVRYSSLTVEKFCSACGTFVERDRSKFCRVCGKLLTEDYQPLDTLRASYKLHGRRIKFESQPIEKTKNLFGQNENSASTTAWAFAVYSMVPYLGIIFCPFAVIIGVFGLLIARRKPHRGGKKISTASIIVGAVVFVIQIFLWLLLFLIPQLGKQI